MKAKADTAISKWERCKERNDERERDRKEKGGREKKRVRIE